MTEFLSTVQKNRQGAFYLTIPDAVIQKKRLRPFMAARMVAGKNRIHIFGFEKTVKIKLDLSKKTISMLKRIMRIEGYCSLDETVCNVVDKAFGRKNKKRDEGAIVYLYPVGFLQSQFVLIDDYEKSLRKRNQAIP